ncbi:xylulokinase [Phycicoccus sp. Soil803]|uniref:xylulokinase n=1 Tax=Phycicoccus sp. Soil803 TaxID=1736415 RepID=UPI0007095F21|nr:FGGY family carbohydrate kinase [Phycicoccus sp. Soil803]KRF21833.1 xylulose kinase [Phycicoccus sp. Soil803]
MPFVAGIDSSTQACKVVIRNADTGQLVRYGAAPHPQGTEVDPERWWESLKEAVSAAGGFHDVAAVSVGGQQHGMVCLGSDGTVIRPALLWNDTRSARAAVDLVAELGDGDGMRGARRWSEAVGSVPVAALTVAKLRWLAEHEPHEASRVAAIVLPHDWLTWRLGGAASLDTLVTDRSDASGTGYFDPVENEYRYDLLALALGLSETNARELVLPNVLGPGDDAGTADRAFGSRHLRLGPGCGDNAGAALGLGLRPGETSLSLGTSGVVAAVSADSTTDESGLVAGFADATGNFLPLTCTLNASRVLDATARVLGVDHDGLSALALAAEPGAHGLVHVPYLEGERTPNLPTATGSLHGMTLASMTRENLARAAVEGMLCLMADGIEALRHQGVAVERVTLVGGAARSTAVRMIAPSILGVPVVVPDPGEYVADGAAKQAAWVLSGGQEPPEWSTGRSQIYAGEPSPALLGRYRQAAHSLAESLESP